MKTLDLDICVIGGGSGGRTAAYGASQLGASTVLIEKHKMGGDCLNYGCVPSKALLAAGQAANTVRRARPFGVHTDEPTIDAKRVYAHVHETIAAIEPNDSAERYEQLGVNVILAPARFVGPREIEANGYRIKARWIVIATGSSPFLPPIPGRDEVPFPPNQTIFHSAALPHHLLVIGGGPTGIEMAQAYRHLGAEVTVLEMETVMAQDDPELAQVLRSGLVDEGIHIREGIKISSVEKAGNGVVVFFEESAGEHSIMGSHILVATGRRANVDELDLENARIAYTPQGIQVDDRLRTTNKKVYAIGDVVGGLQFTHLAVHHAHVVIRNALFRLPTKVDLRAVPRVTYTTPELAQVGLTEDQARKKELRIRVLRWPYSQNDRAWAERDTNGLIKVIATPRGRILGAGIVGPNAGEVIQKWGLAISEEIKIGALAKMIAPYPTIGYSDRKIAATFFTPMLFSEPVKRVVRLLGRLG